MYVKLKAFIRELRKTAKKKKKHFKMHNEFKPFYGSKSSLRPCSDVYYSLVKYGLRLTETFFGILHFPPSGSRQKRRINRHLEHH